MNNQTFVENRQLTIESPISASRLEASAALCSDPRFGAHIARTVLTEKVEVLCAPA